MSNPANGAISPNGTVHFAPGERQAASQPETVAPPQPGVLKVFWDAWKAYSKRAGGYQTAVLLSLLYYVILGPSALVSRLFGNALLDLSTTPRQSYWIERKPAEKTLEALERQF